MSVNKKLAILKKFNVLIAEDDEILLDANKNVLKRFFANVFCAKDGKEAMKILKTNEVHLCVFDLRMPHIDGVELASFVNNTKTDNMQIIIATNHKEVKDFLKLITLDITDYILKPISYDRLIEALLKYIDKIPNHIKEDQYIRENIVYSYSSKSITCNNDKPVFLTKTEYMLLELLLQNQNKPVMNEYIDDAVWNGEMSTQALRNTICRLRQKIKADVIVNVQNQGYMLT